MIAEKENSEIGFIILDSENDIDQEDGKKLVKEGKILLAEPSTPGSYRLKIIFDLDKYNAWKENIDKQIKESENKSFSRMKKFPRIYDDWA